MNPRTQSQARLTAHAVERHCRLLVEALDASLVRLSPECVRWSAVCDPRRWIMAAPSSGHRDPIRREILELAPRHAAAADDLERFIREGTAGHDCDLKAAIRDELVSAADGLVFALNRWMGEQVPDRDTFGGER